MSCLSEVEDLLAKLGVEYLKQCIIEEDGIRVTQVFFHDPDNNMVEICNCDELPVIVLETGEDSPCPNCVPKAGSSGILVHSRRPSLAVMFPLTDLPESCDGMSDSASEGEIMQTAMFSPSVTGQLEQLEWLRV